MDYPTVKDVGTTGCIFCQTRKACREWMIVHRVHKQYNDRKAFNHNYKLCARCQDRTAKDLDGHFYGHKFRYQKYMKPLLRGSFQTNENNVLAYKEYLKTLKKEDKSTKDDLMHEELYRIYRAQNIIDAKKKAEEKAPKEPLQPEPVTANLPERQSAEP